MERFLADYTNVLSDRKLGNLAAVFKRADTNRSNTASYDDRRRRNAEIKSGLAYLRCAVGNYNFLKRNTMPESALADNINSVCGKALELHTLLKGAFFNFNYAIGYSYGKELGMILENLTAYLEHLVSSDNLGDNEIGSGTVIRGNRSLTLVKSVFENILGCAPFCVKLKI